METPATVRRNPPRRAKMSSTDKTTAVEYTSTRKRARSAVKGKSLMPSFSATEGNVVEAQPGPELKPCRMKDLDEQTKALNVEAPQSDTFRDDKNGQADVTVECPLENVSPIEEACTNDEDPTRASVQFDIETENQSLGFFPDQMASSFEVPTEAGLSNFGDSERATFKPTLEKIRVFLRIRPAKVIRSGKVAKKAPKQGDMVNRSIQNWKKTTVAEAKSAIEAPEVCLFPQSSDSVSLIPPTSVSGPRRSKAEEFNGFTHIFTPEASQEEVFDKILHPRLVDLLKGESALVVAMGPTSAGKTHTMLGTGEDVGLLPRSLRFLLGDNADVNSAAIRIAISMFEIYSDQQARSERLLDLLQDGVELSLLQSKIKGLHEAFVSTIEEADSVLLSGLKRRTTASTAANDRSSRSHCIINISTNVPKACDGEDAVVYLKQATLTIADLAGFEREKKTGNQGVRLNESNFINNTSMVFGQCLRALLEHQKNPKKSLQKHFQYSMLTRYLKPYMEARGNMTLIVNVSPCEEDYLDTAFVLRQAAPYTSIKVILPPKEVAEKPGLEKRGIPNQEGQPIKKRRKVDGLRKLGSRNVNPVSLSSKRPVKGHNLDIRISSQELNTSVNEQPSKSIVDTLQDDVIKETSPVQTSDDFEPGVGDTDRNQYLVLDNSDKDLKSLSDLKQIVVTAVENVLVTEKIENATQLSQNIFEIFDKAIKQHFHNLKCVAKSTIEQKGSNKSVVSPSKEHNNRYDNTQELENLKRYCRELENQLAKLKEQHPSESEKIMKMSVLHHMTVMEDTVEGNDSHTEELQVPSQVDAPFSGALVAYGCEDVREHCNQITEMVDNHSNPGITDVCVHKEDAEICRVGSMSMETDYDKCCDEDQHPETSEEEPCLNDIKKPDKHDNANSVSTQETVLQEELMSPKSNGNEALNNLHQSVPQDELMSPTPNEVVNDFHTIVPQDELMSPTSNEVVNDFHANVPQVELISPTSNGSMGVIQVSDSEESPTCSTTQNDEHKLYTEDNINSTDAKEKQLIESNVKSSISSDILNGFQEDIMSSPCEAEETKIGTIPPYDDQKLHLQDIEEKELVVSLKSSNDNESSLRNEFMSPTSNGSEHDLPVSDSEENPCDKIMEHDGQSQPLHMVEGFTSLETIGEAEQEITRNDLEVSNSEESPNIDTSEHDEERLIDDSKESPNNQVMRHSNQCQSLHLVAVNVVEEITKLQKSGENEDDIQENSSDKVKDDVNDQQAHISTGHSNIAQSCKKTSTEVKDIIVESVLQEKLMSPPDNDGTKHDSTIQNEETENVATELKELTIGEQVKETKQNTTGVQVTILRGDANVEGSDSIAMCSPILVNDSKAHGLVSKESHDLSRREACASQMETLETSCSRKEGKSLLKGKLLALSLLEEYKASAESVNNTDKVDVVTNASTTFETLGPIGHELEEILEIRLTEIEKEIWNHSISYQSKLSDFLKKTGGILDINCFAKKYSQQRSLCIRFCLAVISGKINLGGRWLELSKENEASRKRHFYAIVQARTLSEASGHARSGFEEEARFNSVPMEEFGEQTTEETCITVKQTHKLESEEKENKKLCSPAKAAPKRRRLQPLSSLSFQTGSSANSDYDYTDGTTDDHPIKVSNDEHVDGAMSWKKSSSLANLLLHKRK